jgi:hypothetical protein
MCRIMVNQSCSCSDAEGLLVEVLVRDQSINHQFAYGSFNGLEIIREPESSRKMT